MRWSKMNSAQRAFLKLHAQWRAVVRDGKVIRHEPLNAYAVAIQTAKAADHDFLERQSRQLDEQLPAMLAAFDGVVVRCKPGKAYGTHELHRRHATAMPMQYFRKGGGPA